MSNTTCTKHNCDYHDELLTVYAAGNASHEERQRVEKWLSQCADCRRKVMELEATWWALDIWEEDQRQVPLHMNRFHDRLSEVKNEQPFWQRTIEQASFFFRPAQLMPAMKLMPAIKFIPAMSMAAVVLAAVVFVYHPDNIVFNSQDLKSQQSNAVLPVTNHVPETIAKKDTSESIDTRTLVKIDGSSLQNKTRREAFFDQQVQRTRVNQTQQARLSSNRMNYAKSAGFTPNRNIVSAHNSLDEEVKLRPGYIRHEQ